MALALIAVVCRRSRSSDDAELGHFKFLFCRGRRTNVQSQKTHTPSFVLLSKPLFCGGLLRPRPRVTGCS